MQQAASSSETSQTSQTTQTLFLRSRTLAALAPTSLAATSAPPRRPSSGAGTEASLLKLITELRATWRPLQQPVASS